MQRSLDSERRREWTGRGAPGRFAKRRLAWWWLGVLLAAAAPLPGQPLGQPDRQEPGDERIQAYLRAETVKISAAFTNDLTTREAWEKRRAALAEEYFYMLGLSPRPDKTALHATVTGTLAREGYVVEKLHYQSRPGLYVTGNLYRPAEVKAGEKLPGVLYVCGHSGRGRDGNKVAYQSHGIWFARHGYVCLILDTLQLGEIAAFHHGTYNLRRWWWHSRGYTPAGVETWNGIRGLDYLAGRAEVDAERLAVTGISGGGAATFWIAAADERVKAAVAVSGMADLEAYVPNRVINGHCDCMFLHNAFRWPWTRIAALVAPRPLLFVNSDQDPIFPMDANERISARLERFYSLFGAGDRFDSLVSVGGHAYREDIRQGAYRFLNAHLKGDARPVTDSEVDLVSEGNRPGPYPIPPESLRVFPTDEDLPKDQLNTAIDEHFVPVAQPAAPASGQHAPWKKALLQELRRVTFGSFPESIPPALKRGEVADKVERLESEPGIEFDLRRLDAGAPREEGQRWLVAVLNQDEAGTVPDWIDQVRSPGESVVLCEPRGTGATRWTRRNGPNYVERSHALLGRTVDTGRVWDIIAAAKYVASGRAAGASGAGGTGERVAVRVAGRGGAGVLAAYAALLEESLAGAALVDPPASHMELEAPQFLNVLRVGDIPDLLGALAPRSLVLKGSLHAPTWARTRAAYAAAGVEIGDR